MIAVESVPDEDLAALARRVRNLDEKRYQMLIRVAGKILLLAELEAEAGVSTADEDLRPVS